ncbi:hypothetical protein D1007_15032 [Hordeum vulgare]|nr:hypothetical protein D1007_15032 [Hordeum vulgare]
MAALMTRIRICALVCLARAELPSSPLTSGAPPAPPHAASMDSTMARPSTWVGDNSVQPEVFSVIDNTPAIQAEAALLESNGVVVWFDRDRCASTNEIATAIAGEIGALTSDVIVVLHFREKYLVRFVHKHHAKISSPRREVPFGDMKPHLRAWFVEAHDVSCASQAMAPEKC